MVLFIWMWIPVLSPDSGLTGPSGLSGIFGGTGGGPPPPLCPNKLDFSKSCDSQYVPLI